MSYDDFIENNKEYFFDEKKFSFVQKLNQFIQNPYECKQNL